ncbi:MAG: UvrD-helicase domain-containing protein [Gammaproteobacteria bacterium]|nr:UvrD-helicase domain-containing protein [Gammaproteobacteria bacterium]
MTMPRPVDHKARLQACDVSSSFIIQAPAGSGKTELLIQRCLALLAVVEAPESILAITFTKKAAAEMRERVIDSLKNALLPISPDAADHKIETHRLASHALKQNDRQQWNLLSNPQRLQIQTIDSFCSGLTRRLPWLSALGSDTNTTTRPEALYHQAARETLSLIDDPDVGEYIATLLLHLDGNSSRTEKLLSEMLAKRDQWLPHISHSDTVDFKNYLEDSLKQLLIQELSDFSRQLNQAEVSELQELCYFARENLLENGRITDCFESIFNVDGEFPGPVELYNYQQWQSVVRWLMTTNHSLLKAVNLNKGFPPAPKDADPEQKQLYKNNKQRIINLLNQIRDREQHFVTFSKLPPISYSETQWELLEALIISLKYAAANLRLQFVQQGEIDFQEVSMKALSALGEDEDPTDLTLVLDYQLQHILIDEFQDTSHSQYALLKKLLRGWQSGDGKTLFLVGDPMQSIYKFREADVGLFLHVRKHGIADVKPVPLQLEVNFRSTENIVNWVNDAFQQILPKQEDITRGAVSYAHSVANPAPLNQTVAHEVGVEVYPHFADSLQTEEETITGLVRKHVQSNLKNNVQADLAILVKARKHLTELIPTLQAAGLTFRATEIEQLGERPIITDLQMLTRALMDPSDRVAWFALLRAPWCGLLLSDLLILAGKRESSILMNCQQSNLLAKLSPDGQHRVNNLITCILPWTIQDSHQNIRHNIEGCWLTLDGPCYIEEYDIQAVELYLDLLTSLSTGGSIKNIEDLQEQLDQLYAPVSANAHPNLHLMTIHKSKGLQFDTVLLPKLASRSPYDDNTLLRWMRVSLEQQSVDELDSGLLMGPIHAHSSSRDKLYDYLSAIAKTQLDYESGRQLYVACTRAERRLVLTGTLTVREGVDAESITPPKGSRLQQLWPMVGKQFQQQYENQIQLHEQVPDTAQLQLLSKDYRLYRTEQFDAKVSEALFVVKPSQNPESSASASASNEEQLPYYASTMKRHVGTLTHNWLEQIADQPELWTPERIEKQLGTFTVQLKQLGVGKTDLSRGVDMVNEHLQQTLSDAMGQYILSKHEQSVCELALERQEDSVVKSYIIDRSFIDQQGVRWIIDYKTSTHEGSGLEQFLTQQKYYYQDQLENYASLFAALESRPIKLVLYFTAYQKYLEWNYNK